MNRTSSIFWKELKVLTKRLSSITLIMVVWTVGLSAALSYSTRMYLVVQRMIFLFFPTMRIFTSILMFASVSISLNEILGFPLGTLISLVLKLMRLSSEVLPVMGIHTGISGMSSITIRAPHSFEMENVEICILCEFIKKIHSKFFFCMGKRTHLSIITLIYSSRIGWTELYLVLFRMVKLFHPIMCSWTAISHLTFVVSLITDYVRTYLTCISSKSSSSVFLYFMVEETFLRIMLEW